MSDETHRGEVASFVSELPSFEVVLYLVRAIAKGAPVSIQELADAASLPVSGVERMLLGQPGTDWDADGRLFGFGLTLRPTAHRYNIAGRALYTFCATDALPFTHILGEPAVAESNCPTTSIPIRMELIPSAVVSLDPAGAVVSQLFDRSLLGDLRHNVCDHGHFFASVDAASGWVSEHPGGRVLTVVDAFEQSRRDIEKLGWLPRLATTR
ncbi:MAG: organomercurial lyase [Solirubrobacteraceae bacterium]